MSINDYEGSHKSNQLFLAETKLIVDYLDGSSIAWLIGNGEPGGNCLLNHISVLDAHLFLTEDPSSSYSKKHSTTSTNNDNDNDGDNINGQYRDGIKDRNRIGLIGQHGGKKLKTIKTACIVSFLKLLFGHPIIEENIDINNVIEDNTQPPRFDISRDESILNAMTREDDSDDQSGPRELAMGIYAEDFSPTVVDKEVLYLINKTLKLKMNQVYGYEFTEGVENKKICIDNNGPLKPGDLYVKMIIQETFECISVIKNSITNKGRIEDVPFLDLFAYFYRAFKWSYTIDYDISYLLLKMFHTKLGIDSVNIVKFSYKASEMDKIEICFDGISKIYKDSTNPKDLIKIPATNDCSKTDTFTSINPPLKLNASASESRIRLSKLAQSLKEHNKVNLKKTSPLQKKKKYTPKRTLILILLVDVMSKHNHSYNICDILIPSRLINRSKIDYMKITDGLVYGAPLCEFVTRFCPNPAVMKLKMIRTFENHQLELCHKKNKPRGYVRALFSAACYGLSDYMTQASKNPYTDMCDSSNNNNNSEAEHKQDLFGLDYYEQKWQKTIVPKNNINGKRTIDKCNVNYITTVVDIKSSQIYNGLNFQFYGEKVRLNKSVILKERGKSWSVVKYLNPIVNSESYQSSSVELDNVCFIANLTDIKVYQKSNQVLFNLYSDDIRFINVNNSTEDASGISSPFNVQSTNFSEKGFADLFMRGPRRPMISKNHIYDGTRNTKNTEKNEKQITNELDKNVILYSRIVPEILLAPYIDKYNTDPNQIRGKRFGFLTCIKYSKSSGRIIQYKFLGGSDISEGGIAFHVDLKWLLIGNQERNNNSNDCSHHILVYHFSKQATKTIGNSNGGWDNLKSEYISSLNSNKDNIWEHIQQRSKLPNK